jgi:hypothetical protein
VRHFRADTAAISRQEESSIMSRNLDLIRKSIDGAPIRTLGEAIGKTVALTDAEVVTAKAGLFGRWGGKLERYPLQALAAVTAVPNPSANLLTLEFHSHPPTSVMLMFGPAGAAAFEEIVAVLQEQLRGRRTGGQQ